MRFEVSEDRPGHWSWILRGSFGELIARSHADYPSRIQASAAATAFAQMVTKACQQMQRR
ncbi:hypothetical protein [Methylobacterium organophilum]|uniref:DUF1508 domain-containing protein n=1 Tax=Methylobacterium organophilum TaxID=410 RepID=A0ABQ4TA07_METOR|nr:hypothetical protein [Methylobacterium organophilum]UMY16908.1 hypothetical protein MMB17_19980 [Methylobacterium organophilum]GJE27422.1 hypothetical protein LKMONMHP_2281 [Methylobacterium organophilum]